MRSLYTRIFLTCCGTVFVALCCFLAVSLNVGMEQQRKNYGTVFLLELRMAQKIYTESGPEGLAAFLREMDERFVSRHYVVDAQGRDLLTGEDRTELLAQQKRGIWARRAPWARRIYYFVFNSEGTVVTSSATGDFRTITQTRPWSNSSAQFPYYLGILIVVSVINALVAVRIVSALKNIARTARVFGEGNLEARVTGGDREDEIGLVSRAFNQMADRIHALVVSERRLLHDVSHEIRSPLARLSFAVELAENSDDRSGAFALVRNQIRTLKDLASTLLQATRASDGRPLRANERVALQALVEDVVETNRLNALEKRCRVTAAGSARSAAVIGDRDTLARVVDNVLRNAIEYSPADGRIDVEVLEDGGDVVLRVRDFGPGVPDSMLNSIFAPFFRVDESRESSTGGLGLGLAIVRRTVLLHGGSVTATNAAPGLLVTVRLPLAAAARDAAA
jgi:two-component system sensor histidine kinase CpxA